MHRFMGPLLLREGCKLIQVPVKHRPRVSGRSHYNIWNRSLCVIVDLLGVVVADAPAGALSRDLDSGNRGIASGSSMRKTWSLADAVGYQEG